MTKRLLILSGLLVSVNAFAELNCALDRDNPACKAIAVRGIAIYSSAQKEANGAMCFAKARVDIKSIKGTNCEFTTSDSGITSYYRCEEHETAVGDCACPPKMPGVSATKCNPHTLKAVLRYKEKKKSPEETVGKRFVRMDREIFEKCYNKILPRPTESIEDLKKCKITTSVSENSVYADCANYHIEINPCHRGAREKTVLKKQIKVMLPAVQQDEELRNNSTSAE